MEFFSINWATFILLLSCARLSQQIKTERHYFQNATDGEDFHENANIFGDLLSQFSCESGDVGNLSEADEDSLNPDCQQNPGVATERQDRSEQARDQKNVTDTKGFGDRKLLQVPPSVRTRRNPKHGQQTGGEPAPFHPTDEQPVSPLFTSFSSAQAFNFNLGPQNYVSPPIAYLPVECLHNHSQPPFP